MALRNNGVTVSLVALAFFVCYLAIERQFAETSQPIESTHAVKLSLRDVETSLQKSEWMAQLAVAAAEGDPSKTFILHSNSSNSAQLHVVPSKGTVVSGHESSGTDQDHPSCGLSAPPGATDEVMAAVPEFHQLILRIGNPPTPVPAPVDAVPVDPQHDESEDDQSASADVRSVIEKELSHTSREERDIWFDELKTLPAGVVRDLLQVRKQMRALPKLLGGAPEKLASIDLPTPPQHQEVTAEPASQKIRFQLPDDYSATAAVELAISQLRHNLMNAATPGFKRLRVMLVDSYVSGSLEPGSPETLGSRLPNDLGVQGDGCRTAPVQLDLKQGTLKSTGRQLDLAIDGEGFFLVRQGDRELLTRCGALTLDRDRQLCLIAGNTSLLLQPVIRIPDDAREIEIAADGTVTNLKSTEPNLNTIGRLQLARVASPWRLQPVGQTLYLANDDSGPVSTGFALSEGFGELSQGFLEQSNVDFQAELDEIEELTMILKALPFSQSRPVTASGPQPSRPR